MRGGGGELERRHEDALVVPIFLPDLVRPLLPWTRRHVHQIARRYAVSLADCWDEAKTALRRAAVYYDAGRQNAQRPFASRPADLPVLSERHPPLRADGGASGLVDAPRAGACPPQSARHGELPDAFAADLELRDPPYAPSAETAAITRERIVWMLRQWMLRQQDARVDAPGDSDTVAHRRSRV